MCYGMTLSYEQSNFRLPLIQYALYFSASGISGFVFTCHYTHTSHYSITDISTASGLRTYTTVPHSRRWWHSNEEREQWCTDATPSHISASLLHILNPLFNSHCHSQIWLVGCLPLSLYGHDVSLLDTFGLFFFWVIHQCIPEAKPQINGNSL